MTQIEQYYISKGMPYKDYLYAILSDHNKYNINSWAYYEALEAGLVEVFDGTESECNEFINTLLFEQGKPNKYTI